MLFIEVFAKDSLRLKVAHGMYLSGWYLFRSERHMACEPDGSYSGGAGLELEHPHCISQDSP